jgi:hypothetical protein
MEPERPRWRPHEPKVGDRRVSRSFHMSGTAKGYVVERVTTEVVAIVGTVDEAIATEV